MVHYVGPKHPVYWDVRDTLSQLDLPCVAAAVRMRTEDEEEKDEEEKDGEEWSEGPH